MPAVCTDSVFRIIEIHTPVPSLLIWWMKIQVATWLAPHAVDICRHLCGSWLPDKALEWFPSKLYVHSACM